MGRSDVDRPVALVLRNAERTTVEISPVRDDTAVLACELQVIQAGGSRLGLLHVGLLGIERLQRDVDAMS
jgi:hypothetical protein